MENQILADPHILSEYRFIQKIWKEAGNMGIFERINTKLDWEQVRSRIGHTATARHHRISWQGYFLRIAALVIFALGLTFGFYRFFSSHRQADSGFITLTAVDHFKDVVLPDGSTVALKAGSELVYRDGFGNQSREVILIGEALFNVLHDANRPFKVFINESVIEVTGTRFSVREETGSITVSVISGTVILSSSAYNDKKISISANQSGFLLTRSYELGIEEGIPVNNLSWKTGHLVFEETPLILH
jgi:ferric-dicitrate binding protein FerR (iron transport regulator)